MELYGSSFFPLHPYNFTNLSILGLGLEQMVVYLGQLDKFVVVTAFVWMKFLNPFAVKSNQVFSGHFFQLLRRGFELFTSLLQTGFPGFE
jgi:hypothetical protein